MNRRPSELALVAVSLVCVLILAACNCAPTLRYITISPTGPTIVPGAQVTFVATGYYSNGAVTPNISVSWSSSSTTVATINGTSGVATGVATGTTTITATALGITSTTTTLSVAPLTAIAVTPATATIPLTGSANTQQFDAVGTYTTSSGTGTMDITAFVTWAATNSSIATFSTTTPGLATAAAAGTTPITATLDGITGTASLTVTAGTTLLVTPATANLAVGNAVALTVVEQLPNMTTQPVATPVTWSSGTPAQANVVVQPGTTNNSGAIVAAFASSGTGTVTITATEGALTGSTTITVDQGTTKYAYVSNAGGTNINSYTVTASTAPYLATLGTTNTPDGTSPFQTVIDPNGQYLFLTSTGAASTEVIPFAIAANGSLTAGTPASISSTSIDTTYTLIDPYGRFLFVADQTTPATGGIFVFTINQTNGALTLVTGSPFTANLNIPAGLAIDQSGTYLYASNYGNPPSSPGTTLAGFQISPTTGALTPLSTPTFTNALSGPVYMAWDPTGTYLYVANNNNGTVSSFTLGSNGALSALTTTTVTGSTALLNVAVSPNGSYLYVLDQGTTNGALYGFTLSSGKPSSAPITGSPWATGSAPTGVAIDPTSSLIGVDNAGSSNISLFTIGSGGALTATSNSPISTGASSTPYFVTFYNTF